MTLDWFFAIFISEVTEVHPCCKTPGFLVPCFTCTLVGWARAMRLLPKPKTPPSPWPQDQTWAVEVGETKRGCCFRMTPVPLIVTTAMLTSSTFYRNKKVIRFLDVVRCCQQVVTNHGMNKQYKHLLGVLTGLPRAVQRQGELRTTGHTSKGRSRKELPGVRKIIIYIYISHNTMRGIVGLV